MPPVEEQIPVGAGDTPPGGYTAAVAKDGDIRPMDEYLRGLCVG